MINCSETNEILVNIYEYSLQDFITVFSPSVVFISCRENNVQSPVQQNPYVEVGGNYPLRLAINTAQFGRTFQVIHIDFKTTQWSILKPLKFKRRMGFFCV